jgi:hypothetical protein
VRGGGAEFRELRERERLQAPEPAQPPPAAPSALSLPAPPSPLGALPGRGCGPSASLGCGLTRGPRAPAEARDGACDRRRHRRRVVVRVPARLHCAVEEMRLARRGEPAHRRADLGGAQGGEAAAAQAEVGESRPTAAAMAWPH